MSDVIAHSKETAPLIRRFIKRNAYARVTQVSFVLEDACTGFCLTGRGELKFRLIIPDEMVMSLDPECVHS